MSKYADLLEKVDAILPEVRKTFGPTSKEFKNILDLMDRCIEEENLCSDGWSDAEIRAMNGETL